jgi:hypothetical protein
MEGTRLPVLFEDRTMGFRILLLLVVPTAYGAVAGLMLGASAGLYLGLQAIGAVGGLAAGLEHHEPGQAVIRGLFGGLFFGCAIAITHEWAGGTDHGLMPQPALLPVITTCFGGGLAGLGALLRRRLQPAAP